MKCYPRLLLLLFFFGLCTALYAQTDVDLSISSVLVGSPTLNATTGLQEAEIAITVQNDGAAAVQNVQIMLFYDYDFSLGGNTPAFELVGTNGISLQNAGFNYFSENETDVDDVVIIINNNLAKPDSHAKSQMGVCEQVDITGLDAASIGKTYTIPMLNAGDQSTFNVIAQISNAYIGCGLALASEIYSAEDMSGNATQDSDSPYDSYDFPAIVGAPQPFLDDEQDEVLDTDDNITYTAFEVCQFPDQEQCVFIPIGDWDLTINGQTTSLSKQSIFDASSFTNGSTVQATISNSLGYSATFNILPTATCTNFIYNGDLSLTSQIEVDAFKCKYYGVNGNLTIDDATNTFIINLSIENLYALASLTFVTGDFNVVSNKGLLDLTGLHQLNNVGGKMNVEDNIFNLKASFPSLISIRGELNIQGNDFDSDFEFPSLASLGGNLSIQENTVNTFDIPNLMALTGDLTINNNDFLFQLSGLAALQSIDGNLTITNNADLEECCAIADLLQNNTVTGSTTIANNFSGCNSAMEVNNNCTINLSPKVILQGAYNNGTNMNATLNTNGLIPLNQPYASQGYMGTESTSMTVLATTGNMAVVDWVLVELRDATSPNTIIETRAGLLLANGSVVDVDGVSPVAFTKARGANYHVAIRHRNHLGVMTQEPVSF